MTSPITFKIEKKEIHNSARAGEITTPHGSIKTPAFITVGTKATVKSLTPEDVKSAGAQATLANTYHLFLEPGSDIVKKAGGLHKFMNWERPIFTDSGGFQVFSLGAGMGKRVSKIADKKDIIEEDVPGGAVSINEEGVEFKSGIDGKTHYLSPESSMDIQHDLGADIFFAFDECTSPHASYEYQKEAMKRTHRWAERCLKRHNSSPNSKKQALFGVVQGGRFEDLRRESARVIGKMGFSGFGIGGSFSKEDIDTAVSWVVDVLPEKFPRHLLGIGEPIDMFRAVESGIDTFDCVSPTRLARTGSIYTKKGRVNITNSRFREDMSPIDENCPCYTCKNFSKAYLSHLFRSKEMLASTLSSIHNIHFIVSLVEGMRISILKGDYETYRNEFLENYYGNIQNKK